MGDYDGYEDLRALIEEALAQSSYSGDAANLAVELADYLNPVISVA